MRCDSGDDKQPYRKTIQLTGVHILATNLPAPPLGNIECLIYMSAVRWVADDNDLVCTSIFEVATSVMRVMAIYKEKLVMTIGFGLGLLVEVLNSIDLPTNPALLLIADPA